MANNKNNQSYKTDFIFTLAVKFGINLINPIAADFSHENYIGFCEEYRQNCILRDQSLKYYLIQNPKLFRTFLPWRPDVFNTILQTQWYYDELVVYDPIYFQINHFITDNVEKDKKKLLSLLSYLYSLKVSICEGFLLFGSYDTFTIANKEMGNNNFEMLLSQPEIRSACDRLVHVYKMETDENKNNSYFSVRCRYNEKEVLFPVVSDPEKIKSGDMFGVTIDFMNSNYSLLSIEDTISGGFYNRAYDGFKEDYSLEIRDILNYISVGESIHTPVLFNKQLDELVLANITTENRAKQSDANDFYKLYLPFLEGVPPERLFDLRNEMPQAFRDFRGFMFEIVEEIEKQRYEPEKLEFKIQQKVNPIIRKLDVEMKNSATKAKVMSAGISIVSSVGVLGLWHYGVDLTRFASLLCSGLSVAGTTVASTVVQNFLTEQRAGRSSPVYYLWKAQQ